MRTQSKNIKPRLMTAKQVYSFLGGAVGRDKIYSLMKAGVIKSAWISGKLVADTGSVELFVESLFDNKKGTALANNPRCCDESLAN